MQDEEKNKKEETEETPSAEGSKEHGLPSLKDLSKETLEGYGERFWTYLGLITVPFLAMAAFGMVFILLASLLFSLFGLEREAMITLVALLLVPLLFIGILLFIFWGQAALIVALIKGPAPFLNYYRESARKLIQYWWVSVLVGFITLGGLFLFIVPGIIFAIWFLFAAILVITENEKGFNALLKSREYVRGRWKNTLWLIVLFGIIVTLVNMLFNILIVSILGKGNAVAEILSIAWSIVLTPLATIYVFNLYKAVKKVRGPVNVQSSVKFKVGITAVGAVGFLLVPAIFILLAISSLQEADNGELQELTPIIEEFRNFENYE